jgi:predicted AAA+ superfamily ATPase
MKRIAYNWLLNWKKSERRKPLVLYGARQVGKTWLLKEFGDTEYENKVYLNFDKKPELCDYFKNDLNPKNIISALEAEFSTTIKPEKTLIIFDEIQECQRAKDSLKYFNEEAPQYHIASAGSFLGIAGGKFPVGQVDEMTLYPMSFYEFLSALNQDKIVSAIRELNFPLINTLSGKLEEYLKTYFYVGGMPAVVNIYSQKQDIEKARKEQYELLNAYKSDFSKHIKGTNIPKVHMIWDAIPVHFAKEKKKFVYKELKEGGRASQFEDAMDWLMRTGLIYKIQRTTQNKIPLNSYLDKDYFKLYMLDIGLLCAEAQISIKTFFEADSKIFEEFKGALAEQYVLQELKVATTNPIAYWGNDKGNAEVDFVMQMDNKIIPIEVKANTNTRAKSLSYYIGEYNPEYAIRTSLKHYGKDDKNLYSIPLYMIEAFKIIIKEEDPQSYLL